MNYTAKSVLKLYMEHDTLDHPFFLNLFQSLDGPGAALQVQCQLFEMESSSQCSSGAFFALQTLDNQEAERWDSDLSTWT